MNEKELEITEWMKNHVMYADEFEKE